MANDQKPAMQAGDGFPKIRTFKTDTEEYIKEKKISQLDIARGEYTAGREGGEAFKPKNRFPYKAIIYSILAAAIISLAGYFSYKLFFPTAPESPIEERRPFARFLPVDDQRAIIFSESNQGALISALNTERKKGLRAGSIIYFPIKILKPNGEEKFINAAEFAGFLSWQAPKEFLDNLLPEFNMLLFYGQNSRDLAVIFKVKNFASVLASLLLWERSVWFDWKPFLAEDDIKNISKFSFQDNIIKNNDARVLINPDGKVILGYSIFNRQYVVFSTSREALSAILERLIALPPRQ